jgi:hypothetical protein
MSVGGVRVGGREGMRKDGKEEDKRRETEILINPGDRKHAKLKSETKN